MACLHEAIGRGDRSRDRSHVCLHDTIVTAIGRAIDRDDRSLDRSPRAIAVTIAPCINIHAIVAAISRRDHRAVLM